jgi:hypothetical protein
MATDKTISGRPRGKEIAALRWRLTRLSATAARAFGREISATVKQAAKDYAAGRDYREAEPYHRQRMIAIWRDAVTASTQSMIDHYRATIEAKSRTVKRLVRPVTAIEIAQNYMDGVRYNLIVGASMETFRQVAKVIKLSLDTGEDETTTATRIAALSNEFSLSRGGTIARTESHGAMSYAQREIVDATGIELRRRIVREWISTDDGGTGRTRETHIAANGQQVGINEFFKVGEAELLYPGDQNGPPEEVIKCRCQEIYLFADVDERPTIV